MQAMTSKIIKLTFTSSVHFGNSRLSDSEISFKSDSFYSALMIEAVKLGRQDEFVKLIKDGQLAISDLLPYRGDSLHLPKPNITHPYNVFTNKSYKSCKYVPIESLADIVTHNITNEFVPAVFGVHSLIEKVAILDGDNEPYGIGTFTFDEDCGLYCIVNSSNQAEVLLNKLVASLSFTGIGGKKTSGYGKFSFAYITNSIMEEALTYTHGRKLLVSTALPKVLNDLEGARFKLVKRGGFIDSASYAESIVKKEDMFAFSAGSTFSNVFDGDIFTVGYKGKHPVYRFLIPMFISLRGVE